MYHDLRDKFRARLYNWLYRQRTAEPGEVFLHRRRVFIIPSRAGLAFCGLLIVLFVASINYNLSLGFGLTFLVASCALIDMHLAFRNIAHLYLKAGNSHPVFAGEEARFELVLSNRHPRDRYAIWISFIGDGLPDVGQVIDIPSHSTQTVKLGIATHHRGWLAAPRVRLQTRFPLGWLRAWSYWVPDASTLVYPRPEEDSPPLPVAGEAQPDGQGPAGHDDFAGVRAYQAGDSMKQLAWRQIARLDLDAGGTLVSKHFEGGAASTLSIDHALLPANLDVELKLSRMTRWILEAEARRLPYAFRLGDTVFPPNIGPLHRDACLRALALYDPMPA
jgi:uncharacterized protein (DUF58 family)